MWGRQRGENKVNRLIENSIDEDSLEFIFGRKNGESKGKLHTKKKEETDGSRDADPCVYFNSKK